MSNNLRVAIPAKPVVILAPWSRRVKESPPDNQVMTNAKNYPHWAVVVHQLRQAQIFVTQIGVPTDDCVVGVDQFIHPKLKEIPELISRSNTWMSVDSFLQHLCAFKKLCPGVVVWGPSKPVHFGYLTNINLQLPNVARADVFGRWENESFSPANWPNPETVSQAIIRLVRGSCPESTPLNQNI